MLPLCLVKILKNVANTFAYKDKINPFPVTPQTAQETQPNAGSQRWLQ